MKRSLLICMMLILLVFSLTGCTNYKKQAEFLTARNADLQNQLKEKSSDAIPIDYVEDADGITTPSITGKNGIAKLPGVLKFKDLKEDVSNSYVQIGSTFKFLPSDKWNTKISGVELFLDHPAGIKGSLRSFAIDERLPLTDVKASLSNVFSKYKKPSVTYSSVFIGDMESGYVARGKILINKKPYILVVGFAEYAESCVVMKFAYPVDQEGINKEILDAFLLSGFVGDSKLKLN